MSLTLLTSVFQGNNQTGSSKVYGVGSERYRQATSASLASAGFSNNISSATVFPSSLVDGNLIFFGSPVSFITFPDYEGQFVQLTNKKGATAEFDANLTATTLNNLANSILVVPTKKGGEVRLSFRTLFLQKWKDVIDAQLGSDANRKGDPTLTWTMFPQGISHLDPARRYLKIHQELNINVPWWPDYDASITYHIYLFLNSGGHLSGHVQRWAYWVEGGVKSGAIAGKLEPKVIAGMDTLNEKLATELGAFSSFTLSDLFYLPGDQTTAKSTGVFTGTTWDDVTIVAQF